MGSVFSASEPALGYFYQVYFGLLTMLRNSRETDILTRFRLESLDDISVETDVVVELKQLKHHTNPESLTNRSCEFWKTIHVWGQGISNHSIDIKKTKFFLITTSIVSNGSILSKIKLASEKERMDAIADMDSIAHGGGNETNANGYSTWLSLTSELKSSLLRQMTIVDGEISMEEIGEKIRQELRLTILPKFMDSYYERLIGWWNEQCCLLLTRKKEFIELTELFTEISYLRDQYNPDSLPLFFSGLQLEEGEAAEDYELTYVRQLQLIGCKEYGIANAIIDYRKAVRECDKWLTDGLTLPDEIEQYYRRLEDVWKNDFGFVKDECGDDADSNETKERGYEFYKHFIAKDLPRLRERIDTAYVARGCCHDLSDRKRIGWHPYYKQLLENE